MQISLGDRKCGGNVNKSSALFVARSYNRLAAFKGVSAVGWQTEEARAAEAREAACLPACARFEWARPGRQDTKTTGAADSHVSAR